MRPSRSSLLAVLAGVLLIVVIAGFVVALPRLVGDGGAGDVDSALPEELLGGRLITVDELDPQVAAGAQQARDFADERFGEVFGTDVAVQIYAAEDLSAQAEVAVALDEAGFFKPGLPSDPDAAGAQSSWHELERYGEATCYTVWAAEQQTAANGGLPLTVYCQREDHGRTFDIRTGGLTTEETAAALEDVVANSA